MKPLDILFVHPNSASEVYQALSKDHSAIETPIWAGMLAQHCLSRGFSAEILDCEADPMTRMQAAYAITVVKPRIACFVVYGQQPSASSQNMEGAIALAEELKRQDPTIKTLFVGGHVSALPMEVLAYDCVDFVCQNEGVYTISELLRCGGSFIDSIGGLGWKRDGTERVPMLNPMSINVPQDKLSRDLPGITWDLLPSPCKYRTAGWHSWTNGSVKSPFASLYTSLGCEFRCAFCILEGTKIIVSNGINKKIEDVTKDDKLVAFDVEKDELVETEIVGFSSRKVDTIYEIVLDDGKVLKLTGEHPLFVEGVWTEAKRIGIGQKILVMDPNDKIGLQKKLYNPMKNAETAKKVGKAIKLLYKKGLMTSPLSEPGFQAKYNYSKNPETRARIVKLISERMKANNPMKRKRVRDKVAKTTKERIANGEIVPWMCTKEGKRVISAIAREKCLTNNPMHNLTKAQKRRLARLRSARSLELWQDLEFYGKQMTSGNAWLLPREKRHNWLGGKSFEPYSMEFNKKLKALIKKRDKYKCQLCDKRKCVLHVHHIDYDKFNCDPCNLITLCNSCHTKTNFKRKSWEAYFKGVMKERGSCPHFVGIKSIKKIRGSFKVYNFQCSPYDNFFAGYILTHNCCISAPFGGPSFRYWEPSFIIRQFDKLAEMGVVNVKIADEMFVLKEAHFMEVCKLLIERKHGFNLWAYSRVDTCKPRYLETLKKAGVNWLGLGIESPDQIVRKDVVKGGYQEVKIRDVVKQIQDAGICVGANYIFGLPKDTHETMKATLDFAMDLKSEYANFYCVQGYPGSALYKEAKEKGWKLPDRYAGYSQHSYYTQNLPSEKLTAAEILKFRDEAWMRYFTDPSYLEMLERKFGKATREDVEGSTKIKLKRRLLGD